MSDLPPMAQRVTDGGVTAEHVPLPAPEALVAPAHTDEPHNTIKSSLVPFACWRANDMRFEFESSFVRPEIQKEMSALQDLLDRHTLADEQGKPLHKPALTVFGHADPTGSDDFNKTLSGRRAQAIYGMLTRKTELWDDLYSNSLGNDKWEPKAIHVMQQTLGRPLSEHPSSATRKALFKDYMDRVCTVLDESGQPVLDENKQPRRLELKPEDFLGGGADPGGKGDFQGCGEFNPILLFSQGEQKELSDPKQKDKRDSENAPNRRVLIYLFRPGARVAIDAWPCPRAKEGTAGCRKRFWSNADERRNPDKERREYKDTWDTFACRFYDRLSNKSPCERGGALWGLLWITQAPEAKDQGELVLVATDEGGKEVGRIKASLAKPGPGDFLTFDLSTLDRSRNLRLELHAGGRPLGTPFNLTGAPLFRSVAFGDLPALAANFFRVGQSVQPPQTPPPLAVDATGADYHELGPSQPNVVT